MNKIKRISIVTPCLNAERYILETAQSILNQSAVRSGQVELEYVVVDGQSTDRTVELLRSLEDDRIRIISEPDSGMYDALAKGLRLVTGDVVAYLNAGDLYFEHAFQILVDIFTNPSVRWITGFKVIFNEKSEVIGVYRPFRYKRELILAGSYGSMLPFIQQESTFWRRELLESVDLEGLKEFRLAGDSYLWWRFAKAGEEPRVVTSLLGGFRKHVGQLSENRARYMAEMRSMTSPTLREKALALFERLIWPMPWRIKNRLSNTYSIGYHLDTGTWRAGESDGTFGAN